MVRWRKDDQSLPALQSHSVQDCGKPRPGPVGVAEGEGAQDSGAVSVHGQKAGLGWAVETSPCINPVVRWPLT